MKAHEAPDRFLVPRSLGRTGGDLLVHGTPEQLDLFREVLTQPAKLQILAMLALSDHKKLDEEQRARIADIAAIMGYDRKKDGRFDPKLYQRIEEIGMMLYRKETWLFNRKMTGKDASGRRKYREEILLTRLLQEFGFSYEDEDGQRIELNPHQTPDLIEYRSEDDSPPIWAIPVRDERGQIVLNESGQPRRRPANGVVWRWTTRFAEQAKDKHQAWVFFGEAVEILRQYLTKPTTFELIWLTLFWKGQGYIEIGHDKLIRHLDIRTKDKKQAQKAIDAAFQAALDEGVIDRLPSIDAAGKHAKAKRPRRTSKTYRWTRSRRFTVESALMIDPSIDDQDAEKSADVIPR